jgi:hypothetical protein
MSKIEVNEKLYKVMEATENDVINEGVNAVMLLREMKKNSDSKNQYLKKYYAENKEKNKGKVIEKNEKDAIDKILMKLNNEEYKRMPYAKMKKYKIFLNVDTKKFFVK